MERRRELQKEKHICSTCHQSIRSIRVLKIGVCNFSVLMVLNAVSVLIEIYCGFAVFRFLIDRVLRFRHYPPMSSS